jgi:UDPglucose--hexose-1-phosphate uridylyltransferase
LELGNPDRVIIEHQHWVVVVPFWALWLFETLVLPRRAIQQMPELNGGEIDDLAETLKLLLVTYDRLFDTSFLIPWAGTVRPSTEAIAAIGCCMHISIPLC